MDFEGGGVVGERTLLCAHGLALPPGAARYGGKAYG